MTQQSSKIGAEIKHYHFRKINSDFKITENQIQSKNFCEKHEGSYTNTELIIKYITKHL